MDGLIRKLMPPMLLIMWASLWWLWSSGLLATPLAIGLAVSHLLCTIIFYHFVYVFNYGYAMTMIVLPMIYETAYTPSVPALILLTILVIYGLRMASFTWLRYQAPSYAERAAQATAASKAIPLPVKIITWVFTGSLMFYISFSAWVAASSVQIATTIWPAMLVMVFGLVFETIADQQKQSAKAVNKDSWCETGLYRRIRHPNFLGEIIFHLGLYWAMVSAASQAYMYVLGAFGMSWLIILMSSEAVTYDRNQQQRHDQSERYAAWRARTGLLWPKF